MIIPEVPTLPEEREPEVNFFRALKVNCSDSFVPEVKVEPPSPPSGGRFFVIKISGQDELCFKFSDGRVVELST